MSDDTCAHALLTYPGGRKLLSDAKAHAEHAALSARRLHEAKQAWGPVVEIVATGSATPVERPQDFFKGAAVALGVADSALKGLGLPADDMPDLQKCVEDSFSGLATLGRAAFEADSSPKILSVLAGLWQAMLRFQTVPASAVLAAPLRLGMESMVALAEAARRLQDTFGLAPRRANCGWIAPTIIPCGILCANVTHSVRFTRLSSAHTEGGGLLVRKSRSTIGEAPGFRKGRRQL